MVRDVFRLAKENAPAIIFIDEIDAIATAQFDAQTGADQEVQRILMELLNQVSHLHSHCTCLCTDQVGKMPNTPH
jgi:ATP-dependent 26S proteasome regulatory subunit